MMGMEKDMTTAYYPEHNGKIQRWHHSIKNVLHVLLLGHYSWVQKLP